ncbi:MAG TPA: aspartyl protease family protein [Aliidongia sp.]|uniref:aspartyl protease family protein n=1 Tax=Aliidongia sp. TaxID=1914230 RepID=UPI002DDCB4DF|nr:aspartyl protease family protein [Aliidongia sp.]HEV2674041.1 aspartyl protease family protein [Aliidongia sp.]
MTLPCTFRILGCALISVAGLWIDASHAATDCTLKLLASIPAEVTRYNTLVVDVKINDVPVKIRVDTGGVASMVSKKFAERLGMPIEEMPSVLFGLTGKAINQKTRVTTLKMGEAVSRNADFAVMPSGGDGTDGEPVGLFGTDYLQNYDVEFDFAGGKMNLFSPEHCADRVVYWAPEFFKTKIRYQVGGILHTPLINIAIDGKNMLGIIDTGAPSNMMRMASAEDRFDLSFGSIDTPKVGKAYGIEGVKLDRYEHVFQSMTFGDLTLHNTKIEIAPINSAAHVEKIGSHLKESPEDEPDVYVGMNFLTKLHLFISYSENAIYYTIAPPK